MELPYTQNIRFMISVKLSICDPILGFEIFQTWIPFFRFSILIDTCTWNRILCMILWSPTINLYTILPEIVQHLCRVNFMSNNIIVVSSEILLHGCSLNIMIIALALELSLVSMHVVTMTCGNFLILCLTIHRTPVHGHDYIKLHTWQF